MAWIEVLQCDFCWTLLLDRRGRPIARREFYPGEEPAGWRMVNGRHYCPECRRALERDALIAESTSTRDGDRG